MEDWRTDEKIGFRDVLDMILQLIEGPPKPMLSPKASPGFTGPTPTPTPTSTPPPLPYFGMGEEPAQMEPALFDALRTIEATEKERIDLAELSGQESSYGYAGPHISEKEESYGPFHINILAGRTNPQTGKPFTKEEAEDITGAVEYALSELRRTGGLGAWNPGAFPFYQEEIPKRAESKRFIRGK